jgi:hypothetical protein
MSLSKSPLLSSAKMPAYVRASLPVRSAVEPHEADRKLLAQLATRIIQRAQSTSRTLHGGLLQALGANVRDLASHLPPKKH